MNMNIKRLGFGVVVAAASGIFATTAAAQFVSAGGTIRLDNGPGAGPGGEFVATVLTGGSGSFNTFCLERNEYFSYGETLRVGSITTSAMNGGVGGGNPDPMSQQTAWLYTQFRLGASGALGTNGYDFGGTASARASDANALQNAIWYLENEISTLGSGITTSERTQAQTWINLANAAVGSGWTNTTVRVLNLYRRDNQGNFTVRAQDQLYIAPIPEPQTYMMLIAGLGLMGFVARRRRITA